MTKIKREIYTPTGVHVREGKEGNADSRTIAGYAVMFDVPSQVLYEDEKERDVEVISHEAISREFIDTQDVKMTLFHDRELVLARSKSGEGTLRYNVDDKGVSFEFEAPHTVDGDKALELVRRGDISGCSFAFSTDYGDKNSVAKEVEVDGDKILNTFIVRKIDGLYDFTLTTDPAYEQTSVALRDLIRGRDAEDKADAEEIKNSIKEMREAARLNILNQ